MDPQIEKKENNAKNYKSCVLFTITVHDFL